MGRGPRIDIGDCMYHVINRSNGRARLFHNKQDYKEFEMLLVEMKELFGMRILSYEVMPNHWHLQLYPSKDKDLSRSMQWLTSTHAHQVRARTDTIGEGHIYQDRYKSLLIEDDRYFLTVLKYIERNAVRAGLVATAQDWRWGSAYHRIRGTVEERRLLAELPVDLPRDYTTWINTPEPAEELSKLRDAISKGAFLT